MKHTHSRVFGVLSTCLFAFACSSNVDLAGDRQRADPGGAGGAASGSGGSETSSGGSSVGAGGSETGAGGAPTADSGATDLPLFCAAANCRAIELREPGPADGGPIMPGDEITECHGFHVTDATYTHVTAVAPLLDNIRILHHLALFRSETPQQSGTHFECGTSDPGTLLYAWEPGATAAPADFTLEPGDFVLRIHAVNVTDQTQGDHSGASLCACEP